MEEQQLSLDVAPALLPPSICHRIECGQVGGQMVLAWDTAAYFKEKDGFADAAVFRVAVDGLGSIVESLCHVRLDVDAASILLMKVVDNLPWRAFEDGEQALKLLWVAARFRRALAPTGYILGKLGDLEGRRSAPGAEIAAAFQARIDADRAAAARKNAKVYA
jgi:hypothetical protein